ncbi:hypothetical protein PHMEG_00032277 [Phytophthora megakarya]|uniref:Uncharacterized protein n=1 Tax=Phytophthora megakarya TaxID=4795 RepID=A0A225UW18_9STRA|nr:hypothetical protein PHMEG_00032277 [Phytophthora megakarya]
MKREFSQAADYLTSKTLVQVGIPYKTLVKKVVIQERDMVLALKVPLYLLPPESWQYSRGPELKKLMTMKFRPWDR